MTVRQKPIKCTVDARIPLLEVWEERRQDCRRVSSLLVTTTSNWSRFRSMVRSVWDGWEAVAFPGGWDRTRTTSRGNVRSRRWTLARCRSVTGHEPRTAKIRVSVSDAAGETGEDSCCYREGVEETGPRRAVVLLATGTQGSG
jgi:hypothetical protein